MLFHPASSFWRRRSTCRFILSSSAFWQRFDCSELASWCGWFRCRLPSVMLNTLFFLGVRPCFPSSAVCLALFHRGHCGLTHHSTRTGAINPRQPVNSNVRPLRLFMSFSFASICRLKAHRAIAPVVIDSPCFVPDGHRFMPVAGWCTVSRFNGSNPSGADVLSRAQAIAAPWFRHAAVGVQFRQAPTLAQPVSVSTVAPSIQAWSQYRSLFPVGLASRFAHQNSSAETLRSAMTQPNPAFNRTAFGSRLI